MKYTQQYKSSIFFRNKFVILGFAINLLISPFLVQSFDMNTWVSNARLFYYQGIIKFFINSPYPFYSYLVIVGSYFPAYLFTDDIFFFGQPFTLLEKFFIKLPMNICDLFIAYVLFLFIQKLGKDRYAIPVALFYLFNPMSILTSSFWGMNDSVSILFALLGVYHFAGRRRMLSGFELGVSFGLKLHPIILLPLFILLLWMENKREIPKFILAFSIPAVFSILPAFIIQYTSINPIIHFYSFGFTTSILSGIFHTHGYGQLFSNPNMTFRNLLYWFSPIYYSYFGTFEGNEFFYFGILYLLFFLFLWKTRFLNKEFPLGITRLTICVSMIYLLYYLSQTQINENYILWVLPFILILFAEGKLDKIILLTINFIPFAQTFFKSGVLYFVNQNYVYYGTSFALQVAGGFLFSLSCVFVIQYLFKEELLTYRPFEKVYQFFEGIPFKTRKLLFVFSLVSMFLLIVITINGNWVYWSGYPITFSVPQESLTLEKKLALVLFGFLTLLPLVVSIAPTLKSASERRMLWRWELGIFIAALSLLTIITCIILWATIPYINTGTSFFFGWVPVFVGSGFLCDNGGIITIALMSIVGFTGLDLLLNLPANNKNRLKTLKRAKKYHEQQILV